jgi:hypothetical protein
MSPLRRGVAAAAALAVTVVLAPPAGAQQPVKPASDTEGKFHRMEVWNGPTRSVQYFSPGMSPGEESALRDLARAENNLAIEDQLQDLRKLYLRNERILEQRRGQVNPLLYGYSSEYAASLFPGFGGGIGFGSNFAGFPYGYPFGVGGFGNAWGGGFGFGSGALVGSVSNSLANGVGSEGVIKDTLAQSLVGPASTESLARAARAYDAAVARVAESDRLRAGLGWGKGPIAAVGHERNVGGPITVTTKDGKTVEGTLVQEDPDWITVDTRTEEVTLRKSDVTRMSRPKKEVKPDK